MLTFILLAGLALLVLVGIFGGSLWFFIWSVRNYRKTSADLRAIQARVNSTKGRRA